MVALNLILVAGLSVIIGLGTGIASGSFGLNPQVNYLTGQVEDRDSVIGDLSFELEEKDSAMISILENDQRMEQALELIAQELEAKEIEVESLRNLELELIDMRAQLQDLDLLREQLDALKAPDVQMLGEPTTEEIVENGRNVGYTLNLSLMNFGLDDARNVEVTIIWVQVTECGCDSEPGHVEVLTLESLPGRTLEELNLVYSFTLVREFVSVHASVNWAQ